MKPSVHPFRPNLRYEIQSNKYSRGTPMLRCKKKKRRKRKRRKLSTKKKGKYIVPLHSNSSVCVSILDKLGISNLVNLIVFGEYCSRMLRERRRLYADRSGQNLDKDNVHICTHAENRRHPHPSWNTNAKMYNIFRFEKKTKVTSLYRWTEIERHAPEVCSTLKQTDFYLM